MLKKVFNAVIFSVVAAANFYLVEFYQHNPFTEVRPEAQFFNILLVEFIAWGFFFLFGKASRALILESVIVMIFGITNSYVMEFRSTPFVPWDLLSINTAASVAQNYDFTPSVRMLIVTGIFVLLMVGSHFIRMEWKKKWYIRVIPAVVVVVSLCYFVNLLQDEKFQTRHYLYPFLFTPAYMTKVNGMMVTYAMNLEYIAVQKPSGYSKSDAKAKLKEWEEPEQTTEEKPNIIVIMDEAFSDLHVLGDFTTNTDYMPFVHQLQNGAPNTISGNLNVSVCGGNTANTEFEFLTGNTMAFLPMGSIPYQQYIKNNTQSLASDLTNLGYQTYGMHPYQPEGWCRNQVYPLLGFEQSYFLPDYQNVEYVRKYVDDASDMQNIIELYEKKKNNEPMFVFNVTMQNHGGYTESFINFDPDVKVDGIDYQPLEQYLSLVKMTDSAFENLISYFSKQEEKTIVVFFGDHQPSNSVVEPILNMQGKSSATLQGEDLAKRYEVPFVIWANYDIEEKMDLSLSANYLAAQVMDIAGLPLSSYQNYLMNLEKDYPVISAIRVQKIKDGDLNCVEESNLSDEKDQLLTYQKLQYYQLFDRKGEDK